MSPQMRKLLMRAAERIGTNTYAAQLAEYRQKHPRARLLLGGPPVGFRFHPTEPHEEIIRALKEDWDDSDAFALLQSYDVEKVRLIGGAPVTPTGHLPHLRAGSGESRRSSAN